MAYICKFMASTGTFMASSTVTAYNGIFSASRALKRLLQQSQWPLKHSQGKAVNREDKLSRRYRAGDLAKFERSRRYRER